MRFVGDESMRASVLSYLCRLSVCLFLCIALSLFSFNILFRVDWLALSMSVVSLPLNLTMFISCLLAFVCTTHEF